MFLVETQTTIGYGTRAVNEQCEFGILVLSIQCIVGLIINSAVAGIIFTKFVIQSSNRAETIIFSKNATITMRNQELFLLCLVADLRSKNLLEAKVLELGKYQSLWVLFEIQFLQVVSQL